LAPEEARERKGGLCKRPQTLFHGTDAIPARPSKKRERTQRPMNSSIAFDIPEDIQAVRDGVAAFLKAEIAPRHDRHRTLLTDMRQTYEPDGRFTHPVTDLLREVRMASAKAGFYNMCVPESLGGAGLGRLAYFVCWEEIYRTCGSHLWLGHHIISHWAKGPSPVLSQVTPEARERIMPGLLSGADSMCFGMSEPSGGSDVMMIKTRATRDGDGWRLNGSKIWTTNSPHAEYCIVFAVTDPEAQAARKGGISAFLVPTNSPGFVLDRVICMFGSPGGDEAVLQFEDVRLEPWQLVGELHKGFRIGLLGVNLGRIYNMARAVGYARWALEQAIEYTKVRQTFGKPISEYQGVSFPLAESAMEVHAAHLMSLNTAMLLDRGERAIKEMSMAKAFAVQAGARAIDRAIQAHGAMGFTNEMGLTDAWQHVRRANVADGTNEILRRTIWQRLVDGDMDL